MGALPAASGWRPEVALRAPAALWPPTDWRRLPVAGGEFFMEERRPVRQPRCSVSVDGPASGVTGSGVPDVPEVRSE